MMSVGRPNFCPCYRRPVYCGDSGAGTYRSLSLSLSQVFSLFSAYIACLSPLGIFERSGNKNSAASHPSCRPFPLRLFLTELNSAEKHFSFLSYSFLFSFSL
jgi:hypothetical protein